MATYTNAKFIGFGQVLTDGTHLSELIEVRDAASNQMIASYYTYQEIEFDVGSLGSCLNQLTIVPASFFADSTGQGSADCYLMLSVVSNWQI